MKKWMCLLLAVLLCAAMTGCAAAQNPVETTASETAAPETAAPETAAPETAAPEASAPAAEGMHHIEIDVQDYGVIKAELDPSAAPISVENFLKLAKAGFYDGLTFHRIMDGFMIQGGDPTGTGMGGSEEKIKGEFSQNGVENPISHTRGTLSMARAMDMDSASCQFFIVHADSTFLDGQYAAFGHVTEGMEMVDAICDATPVQDNNGTVAAADQPIITAIRVLD